MKTRKEIIKDYIEKGKENLIHLDITIKYLQNRHAETGKQAILDELSRVTAEQKGTEDWLKFLEDELKKEE